MRGRSQKVVIVALAVINGFHERIIFAALVFSSLRSSVVCTVFTQDVEGQEMLFDEEQGHRERTSLCISPSQYSWSSTKPFQPSDEDASVIMRSLASSWTSGRCASMTDGTSELMVDGGQPTTSSPANAASPPCSQLRLTLATSPTHLPFHSHPSLSLLLYYV